jgi:hypothetical protein
MRRRGPGLLAIAIALAAPASAPAQSVGDEQYRDPFAGEEQPQDETAAPPAGDGDTAPAPAPAAPAPTDSTAVEPTATTAATLPRTGPAAAWIAAAGVLALVAGAGLRRSART